MQMKQLFIFRNSQNTWTKCFAHSSLVFREYFHYRNNGSKFSCCFAMPSFILWDIAKYPEINLDPEISSLLRLGTKMVRHVRQTLPLILDEFEGINQFSTNAPLLYPPPPKKISENRMFSDVFRGYRSGTWVENGLINFYLFPQIFRKPMVFWWSPGKQKFFDLLKFA